jgi:hypothetical protein
VAAKLARASQARKKAVTMRVADADSGTWNGAEIRALVTIPISPIYAFLLRDVTGDVRVVHDRHVEGLFARARWFEWFEAAGLSAQSELDPWGRDVFVARLVKSNAFR